MLGTVKSLELLGLATFNIFLAVVLSVSFLGGSGKNSLNKLTEGNVSDFVQEATAMSSGHAKNADAFGITEYLMKHIKDDGIFTTNVEYDLPNVSASPGKVTVGKKDYISQVLQGLKTHQSETVKVESVQIASGARQARVVTTSTERGEIPIDTEDGKIMMPVKGISYCEQTIILQDKTIRMARADCSTTVEAANTP